MWSGFGASASILVSPDGLRIRRFAPLRWSRSTFDESLIAARVDHEGFSLVSGTKEVKLPEKSRVTIFISSRLCNVYCIPSHEALRSDEVLPFALAWRARNDLPNDQSEMVWTADRIEGSSLIILAGLARTPFEGLTEFVASTGASLVSMQPWWLAQFSQWMKGRKPLSRSRRWLLMVDGDLCTTVAAESGFLTDLSRVQISADQDLAISLRRLRATCGADPAEADVWSHTQGQGGDTTTLESELARFEGASFAFLDLVRVLSNGS